MAAVRLFLVGDVMLARGVDMIQKFTSNPTLYEGNGLSAHGYVRLAESVNGPVPSPRTPAYVWGDALDVLTAKQPDVRIINLETSITVSEKPWPGKGIHYKMHPGNVDVLRSAGVDCCVLANNHTADWGLDGLRETLSTLEKAGIQQAGAGLNLARATAPAVFPVANSEGRVLVFGVGHHSSGVPDQWRAQPGREGLCVLDLERTTRAVNAVKEMVERAGRRRGDVVVLSVHWGGNWGYEVDDYQRKFARAVVSEAGVDVVHGHSSHHTKGVEVYGGKLLIYGCGDFINDYEGIGGQREFRGDLALMYFADVAREGGLLRGLTMVPTQTRQLSVHRARPEDVQWMVTRMQRECRKLGCDVTRDGDELRLVYDPK